MKSPWNSVTRNMIAALRETGQWDRTFVIFTSDHGLALGSHGLLGKQNMFDHTVRVPCVVRGPGVPEGARREGQAYLRDLVATILDYCGVSAPPRLDSVSLRNLIAGSVAEVHPFVVGYYLDQSRMIRTSRWKLCVYPRRGARQLFDLANDPDELQDRSGDPAQAGRVKELETQLAGWIKLHGEPRAGGAGGG